MAKGTIKSSEEYLRSVELPEKTETYTVISHGDVIDKVNEQLTKNGFSIVESEYFHIAEGKIARGVVHLECDKDPDMGMVFTWWNSYNKQVKFGCAIGGLIHDNKATLIGTEGLSWARKHTGTSDDEAWTVITELIENGNDYFDKVITEKNKMMAMPLSIEDFGCIMGALYFEHDLITPTQASATKQAYKDTDTNNCLWDLYKHLMYGIDGMDLKKWAKSQQKLHHMIMTEYLIAQEELEGPGLEEEPFIGETKEVTAEELANKHGLEFPISSEDTGFETGKFTDVPAEPEVTAVIDGTSYPIEAVETAEEIENTDAVIVRETLPKKDAVRKACLLENSEALVDYWMGEHYMDELSFEVNVANFKEYAPKPSEKKEIPAKKLSEDQIELIKEEKSFPVMTQVEDNPTSEVVESSDFEEVVDTTDLELSDAIELTDDDFEAQLEAALNTSVATEEKPVKKEEKKEEEVKSSVEPVANLDEPVPILPPKEPKKAKASEKKEKKKPEGIKTKEEEDFLDVSAHDGLEVPAELIQEAAVIEKKMAELYGSVQPYQINKTENNIFVTIDESQESFCLPVK